MPVGEVVGELLGGALRLAGRLVAEVVLEWMIRGVGSLIIGVFKPKAKPNAHLCAIVGLLFWVTLGLLAWFLYLKTAGS